MALSHAPSIVTDGLVLCLDAANLKSYPGTGTGWTDLSNTGNNGVLTNGPIYSTLNGGNINFDGTNDCINGTENSASLNITGQLSVCGWFKSTDKTGCLFSKVNTSGNYDGYNVGIGANSNDGKLWYWNSTSHGGWTKPNTATQYDTNEWIFFCITHTASTVSFYKNGILDGTTTPGTRTTTSTTSYQIGTDDGNRFFNGLMANLCVYKICLTSQQVLQNFNALRGRFGI